MPTVSIAKGKGHARHNDRTIKNISKESRSWNPELSNRNIIYVNEPIRDAYDRFFGESLAKYNAKILASKNPQREIKDYYEHINRSKQEKTCYELIVQIGSIENKSDLMEYERIQSALDKYNCTFQERNPNFKVIQQITHRDEEGMDHTHIMFVPISTGNKRGLEVKNSISGALKEMGYGRNGFDKWRETEMASMDSIMKEYGLSLELGDGRSEHLNVRQYREYKKYEQMADQKLELLQNVQKRIISSENELSELQYQKNQIEAHNAQKTALMERYESEIKELEQKKEILMRNPNREVAENAQIKQIIQDTVNVYNMQKEADQAEFSNDYGGVHDDRAIAEPLTDQNVTIKKSLMGKEPVVIMPLSVWENIKKSHNALVTAFKELRHVLYQGVDKLINLFKQAKNEPEYLNAAKYSQKFKQIQNRTVELEKTIHSLKTENKQYQDQINYYMTKNSEDQFALEILDILGSKMRNSIFVDQNGQEINILDSMLDEIELSSEAQNILNKRIDAYEENEYEHEHDKNEWDWDFDR